MIFGKKRNVSYEIKDLSELFRQVYYQTRLPNKIISKKIIQNILFKKIWNGKIEMYNTLICEMNYENNSVDYIEKNDIITAIEYKYELIIDYIFTKNGFDRKHCERLIMN